MPGPLTGFRIVEFEGIGPAPYCGMLLADLGADVVRIARPSVSRGPFIQHNGDEPIDRGRAIVTLDLKSDEGRAQVLAILEHADGLIEGLRPGVMERLGLGPDEVRAHNPGLVYCRITGWGQEGSWARLAGHDLNYIALSGALAAMGEPGRPPAPPLNLIGDYGGGGLFAAFGLVAGLLQASRTDVGQVVDAAMLDGAASQMTMIYGLLEQGRWSLDRGANLLDGGAPFYRCYECADGKYLSVAAIEPQFFRALMDGLELDVGAWDQADRSQWGDLKQVIKGRIIEKPRDAWSRIFEGTDACVAPVLDMAEAPLHPHNASRETFASSGRSPSAAPRFPEMPDQQCQSTSTSVDQILDRWSSPAD